MKKIFTLIALLAFFLGAKAEEVVDVEVDLTTVTADTWQHGWVDENNALPYLSFDSDGLHFHNEEAKSLRYEIQFQPFPGVSNLDNDASYTITIKIKGSVAGGVDAFFSGSSAPGTMNVTTDWQTLTFEGCMNNPNDQYFANSGSILIQCGDYVGDWWISYVKITHEEKESSRPVEWLQLITNGDAETAWPEWSLEKNDEGINVNWRGDRAPEICAWDLTMGTNSGDTGADGSLDGRARPYPATIEAEEGNESNHVFAVHVEQIDKIDDDNSIQWSNQFWIQAPKEMKAGTKVHLKFRYKAEKACKTNTQIHKQHPSDYLHYVGIGDVSFTTDWQEFDQTVTFSDAQGGGWSVAFNLCADSSVDTPQEPNVFYFDDLSWEVMKLDEGWFVASSNTATGIEYDYDNATELVYDAGEEAYTATVGTKGKKDTWVNELMISTVRGENAAFKGATIKPTGTIKTDDPNNWLDYTAGSQYKIKLPAAGVWQVSVAPNENGNGGQVLFLQVEGDAAKEAIAVVTNTTEVVVNGLERDDLSDTAQGDNPQREEEGGAGETWDNQFFIVANRALEAGEVTVLKFKYKASKEAKTTTQCHGEPGGYIHWGAIGDVNFTTDWQDFEKEFTIPNECDGKGMKTIAFNMAEIKEACDYELKDFQWYLKYDEEGKTLENLIDETGASNFYVKEGAGTTPHVFGESGINTVVNNGKKTSTAIYNLAGQRVSKDYKGIVVKEGKKYIVK